MLLVGDLAEYEVDPGLYLDYRTEMIGTQVTDTDGVIAAIREGRFDLTGYDAFLDRQLGPGWAAPATGSSTGSSAAAGAAGQRGDTLPRDVRHE